MEIWVIIICHMEDMEWVDMDMEVLEEECMAVCIKILKSKFKFVIFVCYIIVKNFINHDLTFPS